MSAQPSSTANAASPRAWPIRILLYLWHTIRAVGLFIIAAWATLALYYSNLPWDWARLALALAFAGFAIYALGVKRTPKMRLLFAGLFLGVFIWYLLIPPSHDRDWATEAAVMPRAAIEGDTVRLTGVRNFHYRTRHDFDVQYEEREVSLSDLTSVDFYISYWMPGPIGHTFVSFNFGHADPVCISIETRPEKDEGYDPIASLFKTYELIYVVGEEPDLVGSRINQRGEDVYLYRVKIPAETGRRLFLEYLRRINELADRPEWYHLLKNNCTLNIIRYANAAGREGGFDIRHLLNGLIDGYLYDTGRIDTSLPFEELRSRSRINDAGKEAEDTPDFSSRIRRGLPGMSD